MSSGSAPSDCAVNPTRSANRAESTLRSSATSGVEGSDVLASGAPQAPQKCASGGMIVPQTSHRSASEAPQFVQKRWSASFLAEHSGQFCEPATIGRV